MVAILVLYGFLIREALCHSLYIDEIAVKSKVKAYNYNYHFFFDVHVNIIKLIYQSLNTITMLTEIFSIHFVMSFTDILQLVQIFTTS